MTIYKHIPEEEHYAIISEERVTVGDASGDSYSQTVLNYQAFTVEKEFLYQVEYLSKGRNSFKIMKVKPLKVQTTVKVTE